MKKIISILACLTLIFSMTSTVFAGTNYTKDNIVRQGTLSNGIEYTILRLSDEELEARQNSTVTTRSGDWEGSVKVPIANASGTNGARLGRAFVTHPDNDVYVKVKTLSRMSTVNLGVEKSGGGGLDWVQNVRAGETVKLNIGAFTESFVECKVSTSGTISDYGDFSYYTF